MAITHFCPEVGGDPSVARCYNRRGGKGGLLSRRVEGYGDSAQDGIPFGRFAGLGAYYRQHALRYRRPDRATDLPHGFGRFSFAERYPPRWDAWDRVHLRLDAHLD